MNLEKTYNPSAIEGKLYEKWLNKKYFHAEVDRSKKPFTIVIPPPNITGKLHMGHALDNTLQDILIRYKRMQGYNALWQPGTDHASIATEVKIIEALKEEGVDKADLGREKFLERAWQWKEEYGGRIISQLKKLGSSCDWDRERFTMDEGCNKAVEEVFVKLYEKGYIYKDATAQTELAESMIKQNVAFSAFIQTEGGQKACEAAKAMACGMPMTCVKVKEMPVLTSNATKFDWVVPVNTIDAEAAVRFLNFMYTSPELNNLLAWGIEGVHYEVKDGVACFMEGEDTSSAGYHSMEYFFGNQYLVTPWEGNDPDIRESQKADMENAEVSKYLGFVADLSEVESAVTAVQNVTMECLPAIASGFASEEDYENFLTKLESAGAQKIIDTYQAQLSQWMEKNQ